MQDYLICLRIEDFYAGREIDTTQLIRLCHWSPLLISLNVRLIVLIHLCIYHLGYPRSQEVSRYCVADLQRVTFYYVIIIRVPCLIVIDVSQTI